MNTIELGSTTKRLDSLPVRLTATVCHRNLKLSQLVQWEPGSILQFEASPSAGLTVSLGNLNFATGEAMQVGDRTAVRIIKIR